MMNGLRSDMGTFFEKTPDAVVSAVLAKIRIDGVHGLTNSDVEKLIQGPLADLRDEIRALAHGQIGAGASAPLPQSPLADVQSRTHEDVTWWGRWMRDGAFRFVPEGFVFPSYEFWFVCDECAS